MCWWVVFRAHPERTLRYKKEMRSLLRCNPGLARRFRLDDAFHFADYSDEELTIIMQRQALSNGLFVSEEVARSVVQKVLSKQRARPNFGNADAATDLLKRGAASMVFEGLRC